MKLIKTCLMAMLALVMLAAMIPAAATAAPPGFDADGVVRFATEPGQTSADVKFFKNGTEVDKSTMTWVVDEERGNVLSLDGYSEYLAFGSDQEQGSDYLKTSQLTFMTWVNFKGTVDGSNPAGAYWQHLFTIYQNADCYLTMSPHAYDEIDHADADGRFLNGWFMEFVRTGAEGSVEAINRSCFEPVLPSEGHYGIAQNEWHHVAVVIDQRYNFYLYIDGVEQNLRDNGYIGVDFKQLFADWLLVGRGIPGELQSENVAERREDPYLHALLDDTLLYDRALSQDEIRQKAQLVTDQSGNQVAAPTTTIYMPTTTAATTLPTTMETEQPEDKPDNPFGLPTWGFAVCVGLVAFVIVMTVIVNMYEVSWRKANKAAAAKAKKAAEEQEAAEQAEKDALLRDDEQLSEQPAEDAVAQDAVPMTEKEAKKAAKKAKKDAKKAKKRKDDDEPTMSIKQAALQKRREEHERFLEEERLEQEGEDDDD